jgi:hypothetical protein
MHVLVKYMHKVLITDFPPDNVTRNVLYLLD